MDTKKQSQSTSRPYNTKYQRTEQESPFFEISIQAINALASRVIDIGESKPASKKYLPLTNIRIVNNSTENIAFYPNQKKEGINIPAGTISSFDRFTIGGINSFKLTNVDTTNATSNDEIKVTIWKEGVVFDEAFKRMHKAFFSFLYGSRRTDVI